jgi:L-iditol 2-dehydrogenase
MEFFMENTAAFLTGIQKMDFGPVEVPKIKDDEVLVKMEAVGVCGSDVHYYEKGRMGSFGVKFPFILGHECAGKIVEVGKDVKNLKVGDRVALEPGIPCGSCEYCLSGRYNLCPDVRFFATPPYNGCLQNYVAHPAQFAFKLPDNVSSVEGALVEPLAIGINAALTAGVKLGDTVVIFGSGCIGLVTLLSALAYGATKVIVVDVLEKRLETAKKLGAITVNSAKCDPIEEIMKLTDGKGAPVVIDCAGVNATICATVHVAKAGGTIVLVGLAADKINGLELEPINLKELTITSIFRYKNLYPTAISAIAGGKIDIKGIISDRFTFEQTPEAFEKTLKNAKDVVKSVILFD